MNKRGAVLVFSLLLVTVLAIVSAALFLKTINEKNLTERYINSIRAFWVAETGIAEGVRNLPTSPLNSCLDESEGCPSGSSCCYNVTTSYLGDVYYQIDSVGSVALVSGGTISRALSGIVRTTPPDSAGFAHAIETTGELVTQGEYTINGTVNENAALNFSDLFSSSKEELKSSATYLYDESTFGAPISGITWVDVSSGTLTISGNLAGSGILVIEGDTHFAGTFDFDGVIYVIGELAMSGTPTINGAILAESGVDIDTTIGGDVTINYDSTEIADALDPLQYISSEVVSWHEAE